MTRKNIKETTEEEIIDQSFKFGSDLDDFIFNNEDNLSIDDPLSTKNKEV